MKKDRIKKIAKLVAENGKVSKEIANFILKLKRSELKIFVKFYNLELKKTTVYIESASALSKIDTDDIKNIFKGKRIIQSVDKSLGAGIKVTDGDNIIDFSLKKYINDTVDLLAK